jgi:hypothetical protein
MFHQFEAYALLIMSLCSIRLKPMLLSLLAYAQCLLMEAYASLNLSGAYALTGGLCSPALLLILQPLVYPSVLSVN